MQQAGYHQVNMLYAQLCQDMTARDTNMLAMVQEFAIATSNNKKDDNPPQPQNQTLNTVSQDTVQLEMLRILRDT